MDHHVLVWGSTFQQRNCHYWNCWSNDASIGQNRKWNEIYATIPFYLFGIQGIQVLHILVPLDDGNCESSCICCLASSVGHQMANLKVVAPPSYLHALFKAHLSQDKSQWSHIKQPLVRLFGFFRPSKYRAGFNTCTTRDLHLTLRGPSFIISQPSFYYVTLICCVPSLREIHEYGMPVTDLIHTTHHNVLYSVVLLVVVITGVQYHN